ncbi:ABC transporter permease [Goodfellowiella coeruleoviolacea]|uniref:Fluoroquinolone transport system permease protein n=1 Tax=Goodfellowiella coeruleoviolacea TaxID=334858 RepID=A0AAE3GE82_9PSEU|nr:ABC transporter permease [Goodfellowiella coeruleoviolacea]MCP2165714.1 fluoroquinolone transport system permease protein [Goodfellowiella coeruleoviolacea]
MSASHPGRLGVLLRLELLTQLRYRFPHAAVFSGLLWLAMLLPMPSVTRRVVEPYVMLGDLAVVGYFFVSGSVFFEKGEGTLHALVATPLRFAEYLASKLAVLTALSVSLAVLVATISAGTHYHLGYLLLGAVLGTLLMLLVSFVTALPFQSISDWYLPAMLPLALLTAPVLHFSGLWPSWLLYLVPTQGPLAFLGAAFGQRSMPWWELVYGIAYPLVFLTALAWLAGRMFDRHVVGRRGGA